MALFMIMVFLPIFTCYLNSGSASLSWIKHIHANIFHYGSLKAKRVTRSVLASEQFWMVHGFDVPSRICLSVNNILCRIIPLHVYTKSRSLFDCLAKIGRTAEKRLFIDLCMLQQNYERREITEVFWNPTEQNPAHSFTKQKSGNALTKLIDTNSLEIAPNACVERPNPEQSSVRNCSKRKSVECQFTS